MWNNNYHLNIFIVFLAQAYNSAGLLRFNCTHERIMSSPDLNTLFASSVFQCSSICVVYSCFSYKYSASNNECRLTASANYYTSSAPYSVHCIPGVTNNWDSGSTISSTESSTSLSTITDNILFTTTKSNSQTPTATVPLTSTSYGTTATLPLTSNSYGTTGTLPLTSTSYGTTSSISSMSVSTISTSTPAAVTTPTTAATIPTTTAVPSTTTPLVTLAAGTACSVSVSGVPMIGDIASAKCSLANYTTVGLVSSTSCPVFRCCHGWYYTKSADARVAATGTSGDCCRETCNSMSKCWSFIYYSDGSCYTSTCDLGSCATGSSSTALYCYCATS